MFKKVLVPLILALVVALPFSGVAYAATNAVGVTRYVGTIISVNSTLDNFKIDMGSGMKRIIHVDSATIYAGQLKNFASLKPSMYVNVEYRMLESGEIVATHILVRPLPMTDLFVNGHVISKGMSSFTLKGNNGMTYTFWVTSKTEFSGVGVSHFRELTAGMAVRVEYRNLGKGNLDVLRVTVKN
jgi:hypothetical protein